ncbi:MAG: flagellar export protein FliJ [Treponema sp.]|nr:flagellar export protein FliJ [Treponema sp.]
MKKFVFELENILDIRRFQQQQAEIELGKALAEEKEVQDQLDRLAQQKVQVSSAMKGSVNFADIANANQFYAFVRNQSELLMNELAQLKLVTDEKRNALQKAMQKTDSLENLKEQQKEEFVAAEKKREMREIDDIVTTRNSIK